MSIRHYEKLKAGAECARPFSFQEFFREESFIESDNPDGLFRKI